MRLHSILAFSTALLTVVSALAIPARPDNVKSSLINLEYVLPAQLLNFIFRLTVLVIIAQQLHANQSTINLLAIAFIVARIFHGIFYVKNLSYLRSTAWFVGFACMIALFLINT